MRFSGQLRDPVGLGKRFRKKPSWLIFGLLLKSRESFEGEEDREADANDSTVCKSGFYNMHKNNMFSHNTHNSPGVNTPDNRLLL